MQVGLVAITMATTTDLHVGYEGPIGEGASYYVQAGASVVS